VLRSVTRRRSRLSRRALRHKYHAGEGPLGRRLARDGYAVLPLLDADGLVALRQLRRDRGSAPDDPSTGIFIDTWSGDAGYKAAMHEALASELGPALTRALPHHRALSYTHIVKWPGAEGTVVAHRDPSFVDEDRFRSLMLWLPLGASTTEAGSLWVVPGSHRWTDALRVHQDPVNVDDSITTSAGGPARLVTVPPGHGIVYDHGLLHLSGPNTLVEERVAVATPLVPVAAQPLYAVVDPAGSTRLVEIDERFFLHHRPIALDIEELLAQFPNREVVPAPAPAN
jgi:hypothetical protein